MPLSLPLRGIVPPLVTPLTGRDRLDHAGLERLIERVIQAGCSGVFILGSTGEAPALSYRLRLEMIRESCRTVRGRVPVLTGITDTSVTESIALGRAALEAGSEGLVAAPPCYFPLSQKDLLRHIEMLARELPASLFLYNIPSLTKLTYAPQTVAQAAQIEGVAGLKDSSGDLIYVQRVLRLVRPHQEFSVLVGPEELLGQALLLGAHGGVSGGANLHPELYVNLYRAAVEQRLDDLAELERNVIDLSERIYRVGDPATSYLRGLKCALNAAGVCSDLPAAPLERLSEVERAIVAAHVNELLPKAAAHS